MQRGQILAALDRLIDAGQDARSQLVELRDRLQCDKEEHDARHGYASYEDNKQFSETVQAYRTQRYTERHQQTAPQGRSLQ